jgi:hypothetical protein
VFVEVLQGGGLRGKKKRKEAGGREVEEKERRGQG